ncbi:helix-turn-helix domain-containing protein [Capnocytophaga cynodegmi]|uniref:DNA-binding helix-turn-helix protein n=1 Tax=Capnocytophaga cynodegmi TaxID=28189 RepID=A0A0B7HR53_9FLAO|nr:helix-turn-helix transcriptional regulator [Capnocytophaga cynodegmi]CEN37178.1 DNA-binding helix-turn-helix protein [Capnocytophaga cynodegmi]CEN40058.1 DNA-binding helix-turn-helix protein [Capnocytophaga cynodegmi]
MVNSSDFTKRLQKVMDYYGLSASAFADTLEIQRSSISHLLSERNKPSLDFILRLVSKFPEVDIYWITQGKGKFPISQAHLPNSERNSSQTNLFDENRNVTEKKELNNPIEVISSIPKPDKKVKKIIFFYDDNSFQIFENK